MVSAILFDCFGVLYPDTYWTMAEEYLGDSIESHRIELRDLIQRVDLGYITRDDLWAEFARIAGTTKDAVYDRLDEFTGLDARLLRFIEEHKDRYKIGMISNVGRGFIERMFVDKPATHYFDTIILSSDVGLVKPDVKIYELAARELGVQPEECVFIDDLQKNVDGAIQAGMQSIVYTDFKTFKLDIEQLLHA